MSNPSQHAIDAAEKICRLFAVGHPHDIDHLIQASIDAALAQVMRENISIRLAIDDGVLALHDKLEAERQKNADLRDTLEYYANDEMYEPDWSDGKETILKDRGREARKALGRSS